jgi:hypothetical protein
MKTLPIKSTAVAVMIGLVASCASPQDQFGYAVKTGNVQMASATVRPNFANMRVYENPKQYSVPMQFAILQNNPRMAGLLLDNGAHHSLDGKNLAYYSAVNGHDQMARYFISRGIGHGGDITLAANERAAWQRQQREQAQLAGLIAFGILSAAMSQPASSGDEQWQREGYKSKYEYDAETLENDRQNGEIR